MIKREHEIKAHPSTNNNKNDVKVYNNFSFTINFGDSVNLVTLFAGLYIIWKMAKKNKNKANKLN